MPIKKEGYSRRNKLQFVRIEKGNHDTLELSAMKICHFLEQKLLFSSNSINFCEGEAVMRNMARLQGTRIYIEEL